MIIEYRDKFYEQIETDNGDGTKTISFVLIDNNGNKFK